MKKKQSKKAQKKINKAIDRMIELKEDFDLPINDRVEIDNIINKLNHLAARVEW